MAGVSVPWKTSNACESFSFPVCIRKRKVRYYRVKNTREKSNTLFRLGKANQFGDDFPEGRVEWALWQLSLILAEIAANPWGDKDHRGEAQEFTIE